MKGDGRSLPHIFHHGHTTTHMSAQACVTSVNLKGLGHLLLAVAHGLEGAGGRALFLGQGAVVRHLFMYR